MRNLVMGCLFFSQSIFGSVSLIDYFFPLFSDRPIAVFEENKGNKECKVGDMYKSLILINIMHGDAFFVGPFDPIERVKRK